MFTYRNSPGPGGPPLLLDPSWPVSVMCVGCVTTDGSLTSAYRRRRRRMLPVPPPRRICRLGALPTPWLVPPLHRVARPTGSRDVTGRTAGRSRHRTNRLGAAGFHRNCIGSEDLDRA